MEFLFVGKIANTHGLKGELRISSNFEYKKNIFNKGNLLYIDNKPLKIKKHRRHKRYDMVLFEEYNDINDVLIYKGKNVFINKDDLVLKEGEYFKTDLIGMRVLCMGTDVGSVTEILTNNKYYIMKLSTNHMIPVLDEFILEINFEKKEIYIKYLEGLINEN